MAGYNHYRRNRRRKLFRLLRLEFRETGANRVLGVYLGYFVFAAVLLRMIEPSMKHIGDSLWYCFAAATTIGFGDFSAVTMPGRIITVLLSLYSIAAVAVFTAVITGFFMAVLKENAADSAEKFLDELERLPELSKEELTDLSRRVRRFRKER